MNESRKMKSSEETFDYTCTMCNKKNKISEAVKFCKECHKKFCTFCLEQHDYYMDDHTLVNPSSAWSSVVMPTERCQQHGKILEMWCKEHDEVLCNTCAFMNHRSCNEVKFIPGEVDKLLQDTELKETIDSLSWTALHLALKKMKRNTARKELLTEKNKHLNVLDQFQKKLIQIVESLGKTDREEIESWYEENKNKFDEDQDCCDELERDTEAYINELKIKSENKPQLFVSIKKGQKLLKTTKELANVTKSNTEFEINKPIEEYLTGVQSLGAFKKPNHLYKATGKKQVNIKVAGDTEECCISDTCQLQDGSFLITDFSNKKLKQLSISTNTITDQCDLPDCPWGVCCVGTQEVAVSLSDSRIQFVNVSNKMTLTRSFTLDHCSLGIVYSGMELYLSDSEKVYVHSLTGTLQRTISHNQSGVEMPSSLNGYLAVIGDRIYIEDCERGLICIDKSGTELYRYRGTLVKFGRGFCTDGQGGVFLCGLCSHNVVQIGKNGEELGVVLAEADGLEFPATVLFDTVRQKLFVADLKADNILLFDLV